MRRPPPSLLERALRAHAGGEDFTAAPLCCVFSDELLALRSEHSEVCACAYELVRLLEYLFATGESLDDSRFDLERRARELRAVLPIDPSQAQG